MKCFTTQNPQRLPMQVKISLDLLFIHGILVGFPATLLPDASFPGLLAFYVKVRYTRGQPERANRAPC